MDIPIPEDIDGKILKQCFTNDIHQTLQRLHTPAVKSSRTKEDRRERTVEEDEIIKERLKGLGYID